jgi:hypothetical protein
MKPSQNPPDEKQPAQPAQQPAPAAGADKPRQIPREQVDHELPNDPDPDDPASP